MALFPRWSNTVARLSLMATVAVPAVAVAGLLLLVRTPFVTNERHEYDQPVQFDHRHHNWEQGIDCRFCHTSVETSAYAGMPSTTICIGCHDQVWNKSTRLEPVRQAFFARRPIEWVKVHDLPDFVYFNHSIHVGKGVGCVSCHGRVDQMPSMRQMAPLTMSWCLDCHRNPGPHLRPTSEITSMTWRPPEGTHGAASSPTAAHGAQSRPAGAEHATESSWRSEFPPPTPPELAQALITEHDVHPRVACDTCHR